MKQVLKISICFFIFFYSSCSKPSEKAENANQKSDNKLVLDSLSIDLLALKEANLLGKVQQVVIENDPVYHKKKTFNTVDLRVLMTDHSNVEKLNFDDYKVVFECEDGYKPEMNLKQLMLANAFLAFSDVDAPKGADWERIVKAGHEMKAAPFYVVYEKTDPTDGSFKWPYNLVKIHFAPANENEAALKPTDESALVGYNLFKKHCQTCHAINGIGGVMGPELNYPKSVTEYWKEGEIEGFIVNPAAYRHAVKMPNLGIKPDEATEIVKYLTHISTRKVEPK